MTNRYTNCPTCGALAYYTGANFQEAGALIHTQNDVIKREIANLVRENARLDGLISILAEKHIDVNKIPSGILLELYIKAIQREEMERQERNRISDSMFSKLNFDFKKFGFGEW